jgi:hypothetical protein
VAGSFEHGNEASGSIKDGEYVSLILSLVYECETRSLTLNEEHKSELFGRKRSLTYLHPKRLTGWVFG